MSSKAQPTSTTDYIYFIQAGDGGNVKIGTSKEPEARMKNLQTGQHAKLRLLGTEHGGKDREDVLHRRYAFLRVDGEWFLPHEDLLNQATGGRNKYYRDLGNPHPLVGLWCHMYDKNNLVGWLQGRIVAHWPGHFLVQLYCTEGYASNLIVYTEEESMHWNLYRDDYWWREAQATQSALVPPPRLKRSDAELAEQGRLWSRRPTEDDLRFARACAGIHGTQREPYDPASSM